MPVYAESFRGADHLRLVLGWPLDRPPHRDGGRGHPECQSMLATTTAPGTSVWAALPLATVLQDLLSILIYFTVAMSVMR